MRRRPTAFPGQCRDCLRRRDVYAINRSGGGTYRRGGRTYSSSICAECVLGYVRQGLRLDTSTNRFNSATLFDIAATLPEAWPFMDDVIVARNDRRERYQLRQMLRKNTLRT